LISVAVTVLVLLAKINVGFDYEGGQLRRDLLEERKKIRKGKAGRQDTWR
jgi:hypothetical protein